MTGNDDRDSDDLLEGPALPVSESGQHVLAVIEKKAGREVARVLRKTERSGPDEHEAYERVVHEMLAQGKPLIEGTLRVMNGRWALQADVAVRPEGYDFDSEGNLDPDIKGRKAFSATIDLQTGESSEVARESWFVKPRHFGAGTLVVPEEVKATLDPALVARLYPSSRGGGPGQGGSGWPGRK